jgi:hypothetical protein
MNENIYINGYCKVGMNISHHKINRAFLLGICSLRCSRLWLLLRSIESVPGLVPPTSLSASRREREYVGQHCFATEDTEFTENLISVAAGSLSRTAA